LIIHKTLRDKRFTSLALKHLIDFVVRRRISLASYAGETSVSYHGRADRPDGCPAVTPSALTRICYTPAKKTYEFIGPLARLALAMQLDELIHPNRYKTHLHNSLAVLAAPECQQNSLRKKSSHDTSNCMCPDADGETMTNARLAVRVVAFTLMLVVCGKADAQKVDAPSPTSQQHILSLNFTNNGQHLAASVGQQIEITLGTIGGPQYGKPEVSSAAIRLESVALGVPVTPGGPTFIYIFEAAAEGQVQVKVPIINSNNPDWTEQHSFAATIHVGPASGNPRGPHPFLTPDQSNTQPWKSAWTNLKNVQQSFKPSLPRLRGVEVELVVANPGPASGEVTMALMNTEGENLAYVSKTVTVADCNHVLFLLPKGGARVSPGQVYRIALSGAGGVFGWKYVKDGYANGAASMNGKPLSGDTPSAFLFRTFGAN